jgi:hypothetical protein
LFDAIPKLQTLLLPACRMAASLVILPDTVALIMSFPLRYRPVSGGLVTEHLAGFFVMA